MVIHPINRKLLKAVVTGACGFIGQPLVKYLIKTGCDVVAVDRKPFPGNVSKSLMVDISQPNSLDGFLDSDTVIFHLAASANVAGSVENPRFDFDNTFRGLFEVLEAARKHRCRVIFPSTASIFDPVNRLPLAERAFPRPTSPYAAAKVAGEAYCYAYNRSYDLDVRIARLFNVYGVGMNRFAIHDITRKIQRDPQHIEILGDGNQIRDYLYIDDAVRGLELIAAKGKAGEDYNLASGVPVRLIDLAKQIASVMGYPDITVTTSGRSFPGDTKQWFADITKIKALGFEQNVDLEDGLSLTINWLLQHQLVEV